MVSDSARARHLTGDVRRVVWKTFVASYRYRVMGLAAETAFFALLSLPPLLFGFAGAIGFIAGAFDVSTVAQFRDQIIALAERVLTPVAVADVVTPTLDDVLRQGRADIVSIGFVIAVWSGSRAISVFVDACTIMYGMRGRRGLISSRALSFAIYVVLLVAGAVLLPLILAGPDFIDAVLPEQVSWLNALYWPTVILGSVALLTTVFHTATPVRGTWVGDVPGSLLAVGLWLVGSWLLRLFLINQLGGPTVYGPLAAPIGIMLWLYLIAFSALIGAAFNAAIASVWPAFAGLTDYQSQRMLPEDGTSPAT